MSKFKVGDRVRLLEGDNRIATITREQVFTDPIDNCYNTKDEVGKEEHWCSGNVFELVEDEPTISEALFEGLPEPLVNAIYELCEVLASKAKDYASDSNVFSNFEFTADGFGNGLTAQDVIRTELLKKMARLKSLHDNGRGPENESVVDTYRDLAGYSLLAFAKALKEQQ